MQLRKQLHITFYATGARRESDFKLRLRERSTPKERERAQLTRVSILICRRLIKLNVNGNRQRTMHKQYERIELMAQLSCGEFARRAKRTFALALRLKLSTAQSHKFQLGRLSKPALQAAGSVREGALNSERERARAREA